MSEQSIFELKMHFINKLDELIGELDLDYNLWFKDRQYVLKELIFRIIQWYCGLDDNIERIVIHGVSSDGEKYMIKLEP